MISNSSSLWIETAPKTNYAALDRDLRVDALVIGGGITGLTAAYLLRKAGLDVALLERGRIGSGETGHTTAHLTCATDARLSDLAERFGRDHAQAAWDAGASAMDQIRSISEECRIECDLRFAPAFLVAAEDAGPDERERLREEVQLAEELGFDAGFAERAPVLGRPAMWLPNQFRFHPLKYLNGLAHSFVTLGGQLFENTDVANFGDDPRRITANGHTVAFDFLVIATHVPLQGNTGTMAAALFQTKLAAYSTYAIQGRVPTGSIPAMMWWDTADPYLYLRCDRHADGDVVILGGEDHKTGQETDTEARYRKLEETLRQFVPDITLDHRWSGQVIESVDGLPYIGEVEKGQFLATGFAGNGITFGTVAGMMACDLATGRKNPWSDLFAIERKTLSATWDYLRENSDYPFYLAKGHLVAAEAENLSELKPDEGKIVRLKGRKAAAFRDDKGAMHLCSAICPHLGCVVAWNAAEKTWDCPCHGSRFQATGELMSGPAENSLAQLEA